MNQSQQIPSPGTLNAMVVSDSNLIRRTLTEMLEAQPDIRVVAAGDRKSALRDSTSSLKPQVAVLHGTSQENTEEADALRKRLPKIRFVLVDRNVDAATPTTRDNLPETPRRLHSPFGSGDRAWSAFRLLLLSAMREAVPHPLPSETDPEDPCPDVLVLDDEPSVRLVVKSTLTNAGYRVEATEHPGQILHLLEQHTVKVVLTDLLLPGISGLELAAQVREQHPETKVILMTGAPTATSDSQIRNADIHALLHKPFTLEELLLNVADACRTVGTDSHHPSACACAYALI